MIEIEINSKIPEADHDFLRNEIQSAFETLLKSEVIDPTVTKILISRTYNEVLDEYNSKYNIGTEPTTTRGMASSYHILRLPDGTTHALINDSYVKEDKIYHSIFTPLIEDYQYLQVHKFASKSWQWDKMNNFENDIANILISCFSKYDSVKIIEQVEVLKKDTIDINPEEIHEAFQMKIKDAHFVHQSDEDVDKLWRAIKNALKFYFENLIEARLYGVNTSYKPEWDDKLNPALEKMLELCNPEIPLTIQSIRPLAEALKEFLLLGYIRIGIEAPVEVRVHDHPKILFPDLLDTQNSLVAFIDILGFSDIVKKHDSDRTTRILKKLHHTMESALALTVKPVSQIDKAHQQTLKFRQFSDCVCISSPFYDNPDQFIAEYALFSIMLRVYQYLMMTADFYIRGGFAVGSFFSDENMIFSGGLVKAYWLEHEEAIYPRILVDSSVIERIDPEDQVQANILVTLNLTRSLIYDKSEPGKVFLNPFEITWGVEPPAELRSPEYLNMLHILQDHLFVSLGVRLNLDAISQHANSFEKISQFVIRSLVENHIKEFRDDERKRSKYEWLLDLLNFVEGRETIRRFRYFLPDSAHWEGE